MPAPVMTVLTACVDGAARMPSVPSALTVICVATACGRILSPIVFAEEARRLLPQDLANRLRRHTEASIFSRHEELAHVVLNAAPVVGLRVDQGEANQPFLHTDQQRIERANNC
jgi:hypothetical protein